MTKKETIIVFGAHSDDFVIGAGGTIAKSVQEGKKVISIVFSYGENSHPWLKEQIVQKIRSKEAFDASEVLGCETFFYGLKEMKFKEGYEKKDLETVFLKMINEEKPTKIFTHSNEDPHPDHQDVHQFTLQLFEKINFMPKPELYIYSVWNPVSFRTKYPALYVDISKTFFTKLKALKTFRSQRVHVAYPFFLLMFRAVKSGFKIRKRFGEKFFRIK